MGDANWRSCWDDPFGWRDDVSKIELKKKDGSTVMATGGWVDAAQSDHGEYPIIVDMVDENGSPVYFFDFDFWRIATR